MMDYFKKFSSNTIAGSGNQLCFSTEGKTLRGRVLYRIEVGGKFNYSLLFSNIIDSTYYTGETCCKNVVCRPWRIHSARVGLCRNVPQDRELSALRMDEDIRISWLAELTFDGKKEKLVAPGEFFASDPVELCFARLEYLCLEMTYSGDMLPHHIESRLPIYVDAGEGFQYDMRMPLPGMVGCDRPVCERVGFFGDSITQGIGPACNSYLHWNAHLSRGLGERRACWNLGIGFARANDAASRGAWFYKAMQNDTIFICFGVNDLYQGFTAESVKADLTTLVRCFKGAGKRVILQTLPPFDYKDQMKADWLEINRYILEELSREADAVFDNVPLLRKSEEEPERPAYGGHPNAEGCKIWANALMKAVLPLFPHLPEAK